jgi:hypothetical protein
LWEVAPNETRAALQRHDEIVARQIKARHGLGHCTASLKSRSEFLVALAAVALWPEQEQAVAKAVSAAGGETMPSGKLGA